MQIAKSQSRLLVDAGSLVRRFVTQRGEFTMFALALHRDGKIGAVQPTEEFATSKEAFVETLRVLMALAHSGEISAAVICTPMTEAGQRSAMYDLEARDCQRVLAVQPYKKRLLGGWAFGQFEYAPAQAKLFAAGQGAA
jgi:hypothetical protein